jgi:hypothetical protein
MGKTDGSARKEWEGAGRNAPSAAETLELDSPRTADAADRAGTADKADTANTADVPAVED